MRVYASAEMTLTDTNDGISVTGIDRYYMASSSSSGITIDSQGWKPDPQETNPISRYHWSYEVVNYSSGPPVPTKPAVIGVYGKDGKEGVDAVTVALSSEAHTFAGTESKAIASSITIDINAFKGNQRIPTSIGTVTGGITGQLTHSEVGRGTTSNKLVINVTSLLNKANGTLSIPIVADGRTFNKVFSWSVAFKGIPGDKGIDGTTTYTWIRYADTPTSGMSNLPVDKKYIGLSFNQTTQTESSNYNDYQWSLMPQNIEIGGRNLLRNSGEEVSNGTYNIARYDLTDEIKQEEEVTLTIWGSLATTKSHFSAYNSGGSVNVTTLTDNRNGTYSSTFKWKIGTSSNTFLNVYAFTNAQTGISTINKIKLERGNVATDWSPAPEDTQGKIDEKANNSDLNDTKEQVKKTIKTITEEYYQSTSSTSQTGGDWTTVAPTWQEGKFIFIRSKITYVDNTTDYTPIINITGAKGDTGEQGPRGIQGPSGSNGQSQWVHVRYSVNSNGSGMTTSPSSTTKYVGIAVTNSATAPAYTGFTWSKYVGENGSNGAQGPQGLPGQKGTDGTTTYTWVRYADTPTSGMNQYPDGKKYIGLSFNQTTQTESSNYNDYQWSLMPQNIEIGGRNYLKNSYNFTNVGTDAIGIVRSITGEGFLKIVASPGNSNYSADWGMAASRSLVDENVKAGEIVTYSMEVRSENSTQKPTFYLGPGMGYLPMEGSVGSEWSRIYVSGPWTATTWSPHIGFSGTSGTFEFRKGKLEKGNTATDWTPAPEDVTASIKAAQDKANAASQEAIAAQADATVGKNMADNLSNDSIITQVEKLELKREWDAIVKEKPSITIQATDYALQGSTEATTYNTAYTALNNSIPSLLANMNVTSGVTRSTFNNNFANYYDKRQLLLNRIAKKAKELADIAQSSVDNLEIGGRNLIINKDIVTGIYLQNQNGATAGASTHATTDFIPVMPSSQYILSTSSNLVQLRVVYYTSAKVYISGVLYSGNQGSSKQITTPSNAAFVRWSGDNATSSKLTEWMFEKGNKASSWTSSPEDIEAAYTAIAQAKAEEERIKAEAYADGKVTDEEKARIADANAKLTAAKQHAENISKVQDIGNGDKKFINVGGLGTQPSSTTGYLVIKTPLTSAYMTKMKISGYNYVTNKTNIDISVSFYAYSNNSFHQYGFISSGNYSYDKVQLARDSSGRSVVIIGNQSDAYSYPKISIDEVLVTYNTPPDSFKNGFSAEIVTDISMYTNVVNVPGNDTQSQINKSVKTTDVEYYLSTSSTGLAGGSWQTTAPAWVNGRFMWSRTKVVLNDGTTSYNPNTTGTNITGASGATGSPGATGRGISSIVEQFYLSDSKTTQTGGSWSTNMPTWSVGKYVWTRSLITYTTGTPTTSTTEPLVSSEWEAVNELEIGGVNLLKNSNFKNALVGWSVNGTVAALTVDGRSVARITNTTSGGFYAYPTKLVSGSIYTISFDARSASGASALRIGFLNEATNRSQTFNLNTTWERYTYTTTNPIINGTQYFHFYSAGSAIGMGAYITNIQLEKGNKPTDWTPAPEDIEDAYTAVAQAKAEAERVKAETYADGKVSDEEAARIADADTKLAAAKKYAEDQILADKTIQDTRNDNQTPAWYYTNHPRRTIKEFKFTSTVGVVSSEGTYGILETEIPWGDASGGPVKQTFRVNSKTFKRSGTTTSWSSWVSYDDIAETAKFDAATAKGIADGAASSASTANSLLTDIASDSKLTATEKKAAKKEWDIIVGEKPKIDSSADTYGITTQKTAYNTAYNALNTYLSSLLANLNTTSNIVGTTFRANFKAYYDARQDLLNKIADSAKSLVDGIEIGGVNMIVNSNQFDYSTTGTNINTHIIENITEPLIIGKEYTFSFDIKATVNGKSNRIFMNNSMIIYKDFNFTSEWARHFVTFVYNGGNYNGRQIHPHLYPDMTGTKYIRNIKLETGNKATGWSLAPEDVALDVNKKTYNPVRYIRDWSNGSTANAGNHWYELMAIDEYGNNIALSRTVTSNGTGSNLPHLTNGITSGTYASGGNNAEPVYVQVDLGQIYYNIVEIKVWKYYNDGRTYHENKTEVSSDGVAWYPIYDYTVEGEYTPTEQGKSIPNTIAKTHSILTGSGTKNIIDEKASAEDLTNASNDLNTSIGDLSNTVEGKLEKSIYEEFLEHNANIQQQLSESLVSAEESISNSLARTATVEQNLGEGAADWIFTHTKIRMSDDGITLGEEGSGSYLQISNNQISFFNGSTNPVAFINGGMLHINHAIFVESIQISEFMLSSEIPGHLTLRYVGN